MKLPQRLEHTDRVVAALVDGYRAADVPAPPIDKLVAKFESGYEHPLDQAAPSTRAFRPRAFGVRTWLAGALGAALLAGTAHVATRQAAPAADTTRPNHSEARTSSPVTTDAVLTRTLPSQSVETLPSAGATAPTAVASPNGPAPRPEPRDGRPAASTSTSSLRRELELVEGARRALRSGDGAACLSSVERYEHEFPSGQFAHEGQVMRIEAFALMGRRDESGNLARAFLDANPKSPYTERVRSVLARVEAP